ncbi:MAG: phenylalanine--tRNA ligase subunit beta [Verrucomicrobia bacterium]|nr:phenylalanine--tRNA ligase subunit beta [Verrucomicrobiota bacterium]
MIAALPGAILPGDFAIKESKLRGVDSQGMLCSERELGLGEDQGGIAILAERPAPGTPVNEVFSGSDVVFDIEVTPNRPDCLSHLGIARELAAYFRRPLSYPQVVANESSGPGGHLIRSVRSETEENCPHYRGYSIRGVTIGESPSWLKERLASIGLRPINNVVDATNFVLHELGQPLHAFDAKKIAGGEIIVRMARANEKITTLDEKERALDASIMVIADADKPLVIAGVMGSVDAEVDQTTQDVFLESAYFRSTSIRKTSRRLGLSTDSSYRFERGVDPKGAEFAALRCVDLILEIAGGEFMGHPLTAGEAPFTEKEIELTPTYVRERLGFDISDPDIIAALEALELDVTRLESDDNLTIRVGIPSFRLDLYRPIDLVEEVLRIYGSDRIPQGTVRCTGLVTEDNPITRFNRRVNTLLVGKGFNEVMHYSLRSEDELRDWFGHAQADNLALTNPLASDASHLRASLIPGLLDCLALNQARQNEPRALFETGRVFREENGKVYEMVSIAFVLLQDAPSGWLRRESADFYTVAQIASELLAQAGVGADPSKFTPLIAENAWQEGHSARFGGFKMGFEAKFGLLNPAMTKRWDVRGMVLAGAVYLTPTFLQREPKRRGYKSFSSFPAALRDLALVLPENISAGQVRQEVEKAAIQAANKQFAVEAVEIFDVYRGKGLPDGHKSIAFSIAFRSSERTLQDKEVAAAFDATCKSLTASGKYSLRA